MCAGLLRGNEKVAMGGKWVCIWVVLIGWMVCLQAQSLTLQVLDLYTGEGIASAQVVFEAQDTVHTDVHGLVALPRKDDGGRIDIHHPDFISKQVIIDSLSDAFIRIYLRPLSFELDEVVFTANKFKEKRQDVPQEIAVITAPQIQFRSPQSTAHLLEQIGGVFVQRSQMGGGSPNLRGFEANKVLLVVDGIRMNNAIYRSGHLQNVLTLDPAMIARTEVLFGPGSVMYGSDALGGVMHFYTKQPVFSYADKPLVQAHSTIRYGTANREKYLHADVNIGGKKWAYLGSISAVDFGDLRVGRRRSPAFTGIGLRDSFVVRQRGVDQIVANTDPNRQVYSGYQQLDVTQKISYLASNKTKHTLNVQFSTSSDIPRYDRLTQMRDGRLRFATWNYGPQQRLLTAYHLTHESSNSWYDHIKLTAAYQDVRESRLTRSFQELYENQRNERVQVGSINADLNKVFNQHHELAYGFEGVFNQVTSTAQSIHIENQASQALSTRYPDAGTMTWTTAFYLTHRWEMGPKWIWTEGIRYSDYRLHASFTDNQFFDFDFLDISHINSALSGQVGLVFLPSVSWRLAWNAGTGFRAPNLDDVAKVFDSQPGNVVVPNPDLRPEYTYNTDLSVTYQVKPWFRASVTGFFTFYDQAIVVRDFKLGERDSLVYEGILSNIQANVNAQQAALAGLNSSIHVQLGRWHADHTINYTYGKVLDENVPLDHIPPLFGQGSVGYRAKTWQVEGFISYQGWKRLNQFSPRDINNLEFATAAGWPAWYTLNFKGSYELTEDWRIQAGVDNMLGVHYRPYSSRISAPGRHFYFSVHAQL